MLSITLFLYGNRRVLRDGPLPKLMSSKCDSAFTLSLTGRTQRESKIRIEWPRCKIHFWHFRQFTIEIRQHKWGNFWNQKLVSVSQDHHDHWWSGFPAGFVCLSREECAQRLHTLCPNPKGILCSWTSNVSENSECNREEIDRRGTLLECHTARSFAEGGGGFLMPQSNISGFVGGQKTCQNTAVKRLDRVVVLLK